MIRILALFGLAAGFLLISPKLRDTAMGGFSYGVDSLQQYSPWSYMVLGVVLIGSFFVSLNRGSQPR